MTGSATHLDDLADLAMPEAIKGLQAALDTDTLSPALAHEIKAASQRLQRMHRGR